MMATIPRQTARSCREREAVHQVGLGAWYSASRMRRLTNPSTISARMKGMSAMVPAVMTARRWVAITKRLFMARSHSVWVVRSAALPISANSSFVIGEPP